MIPSNAAEMTAPWLTEVLRNAHAIDLDGRRGRAHADRGGCRHHGRAHQVALTYDHAEPGAPSAVVVKLTSPFEANRQQGIALGVYEAEVRFYNELAGRTAVGVPTCLPGRDRPDRPKDFVIVLDDLSDTAGGRSVDRPVHGAGRGGHRLTLADLHSGFWRQVDDIDWVASVVHERIKMFVGRLARPVGVVLAAVRRLVARGRRLGGRTDQGSLLGLMCTLGDRPWTLIHQDFRCDNLFFGATR